MNVTATVSAQVSSTSWKQQLDHALTTFQAARYCSSKVLTAVFDLSDFDILVDVAHKIAAALMSLSLVAGSQQRKLSTTRSLEFKYASITLAIISAGYL